MGHQNPQISGKKWIFFHFPKKNWNFFQISINLFYLSFNLKKRKKKLENLFFRDPQIFGTKVDFFPIGKIGIRNVPNFNNFISSKLHIDKKKIKIGEPFFSRKKCQIPIRNLKKKIKISGQKWIFFQSENSESKIFEI